MHVEKFNSKGVVPLTYFGPQMLREKGPVIKCPRRSVKLHIITLLFEAEI